MQTFCKSYSLNSLIKQPTCFKNLEKPSCIDLILTNKPRSFQTKCAIETGLSDFHRMAISVLKMHFRKLPPNIISYRHFKKFDNERFMDSSWHTLGQESFDWSKSPDKFYEICHTIFNTHPPKKKKYICGPLSLKRILKLLCKEHALETNFWKILTTKINYSITNEEIIVSLLRKEKKEYFAKLNEKDITDNRKFWHTIKPFLSDKVKSREAIILVDNENIKSNENKMANIFNDFFSYIVKNLKIPKYECENDLHSRLSSHPDLQAIMKYRNHPSINIIRHFSQR